MTKRDVERLINNWNDKKWLIDGNRRNWIMLVDGDDRYKYRIVWCGSFRIVTESKTYRELYRDLKYSLDLLSFYTE